MNEAAKNVETQASQTPEEGNLLVMDTNCRGRWPEREHLINMENGGTKAYTFHEGKYLEMPHSHAMKFLVDASFIVCERPVEDGGKQYQPLPKGKKADGRFDLQHDELVARYPELTKDALLIRAQAKNGGEDFTRGTVKEVLISFLMDVKHQETQAKKAAEDDIEGEETIDSDPKAELSGEEVDAMFGD